MSREVTEAHYLHERSGLIPVLRPPVTYPTALCWVPKRESLVVATRAGELITVDPVLGTKTVAEGIGEAAVVAVADDRNRYMLMTRSGSWTVGTLKGDLLVTGRHQFLGSMSAFFAGDYVVMVGDEGDGRRAMAIYKDDRRTAYVRLPDRVVATLDENGGLVLCRSTQAGLEVVSLGALKKGKTFRKGMESTVHRLRPSGTHVMGFTTTGIVMWERTGGQPASMRLPDLTAGDVCKDGQYLGLGTRNGAVALARMDNIDKRVHPDLVRAFNSPVTSIAFSTRGKWLATGAEGLRIWSWED